MNAKISSVYIALILAVLLTVVICILPWSANLIVAYAFAMLALAGWSASVFMAKKKNVAASYAFIRTALAYIPCTLAVSAAVLFLQYTKVYTLNAGLHVLAQAIVLALFAIRFIKISAGKAIVDDIDDRAASSREKLTDLLTDAELMLKHAGTEEEKAAVRKLADAIRYSDPIGNEKTAYMEQHIAERVRNMDPACILQECEDITALLAERNTALKRTK